MGQFLFQHSSLEHRIRIIDMLLFRMVDTLASMGNVWKQQNPQKKACRGKYGEGAGVLA